MLKNKIITIAVTGCTPASSAYELVSILKWEGADVHVVMTEHATEFASPLVLKRESQNPVLLDPFIHPEMNAIAGFSISYHSDLIIVVPLSANTAGKLANGIADNYLTTNVLAAACPVLLVPHMEPNLYNRASIQRNMKQLREDGYYFVDNGAEDSTGRIPFMEEIVQSAKSILAAAFSK